MKKIIAILLSAALMLSFASCSNKDINDGNVSTSNDGKIDSDAKRNIEDDIKDGARDAVDGARDMMDDARQKMNNGSNMFN